MIPISIGDFERANPEIKAVQPSRSRVEYYFTCTPAVPLYVLGKNPAIDVITYLDADLYFFSDPAPIFDELGAGSILIIEHRFPDGLRHLEKYGRFNVGVLSFRNDGEGLRCLSTWRQQCIAWCYDRLEDDRYADQKYLDRWPAQFNNLVVAKHKGANVAPWNVFRYSVHVRDGIVKIDEQDLIVYHFHQLKLVSSWVCDPGLWRYGAGQGFQEIRNYIYRPYLTALKRASGELQRKASSPPGTRYGNRSVLGSMTRSLLRGQLMFSRGGFAH